jgi:hypothetical protein
MIVGEFNNLAREIPQYQTLIKEKAGTLRSVGEDSLPKDLLDLFRGITKSLTIGTAADNQKGPIPVTVESCFLPVIQSILGSMLDVLVNVGLVLLLVLATLSDQLRQRFETAGADYVGQTFAEVARQLETHHPIVASTVNENPPSANPSSSSTSPDRYRSTVRE